ncbi:MAG: peptidylprolyl isomerase [Rhodospirillaceae bacterium]
MTQASNGDTVRIHYSGKLKDGTVFDSSDGKDPLQFTIGEKTIIPDLEESVVGMTVGDAATVEIMSENAYGPRRPEAVQAVERSMIPENVEVAVGSQLQATAPDGQVLVLTVVDAGPENVTLDANHPLAGEDLVFDIELVEIVSSAA